MQLRVRLVWNNVTSPETGARAVPGLGRVIEDDSPDGYVKTLWINARGLLRVGVVVAIVCWFSAATALALWLDRNPYNHVGFADLVAPWRWPALRALRAKAFIDAGLDALRERRVEAAIPLIKMGLARHPDDSHARFVLAERFVQFGAYAQARDLMLPQLAFRAPRSFVKFLIEAARSNDDWPTALLTCEQVLAGSPLETDERGWLLEQKATALLTLSRPSEAMTVLDAAGRERSIEWRKRRIEGLVALDRSAEAVDEVRRWEPGLPETFRLDMLAYATRSCGRVEDTKMAMDELLRSRPSEIVSWTLAIGHLSQAGLHDAAWTTLQAALRRFDSDPAAVNLLQRVCAETKRVDLLALLAENARELGRPLESVLFDLALVHLQAGDSAAADRSFLHLQKESAQARERLRPQALPAEPMGLTLSKIDGPVTGYSPDLPGGDRHELPRPLRDLLEGLLAAVRKPTNDPSSDVCAVLERYRFSLAIFTTSAEVLAKAGHWQAVENVALTGLRGFSGSTRLARWSETARAKIAALPPQPEVVIKLPTLAVPTPPQASPSSWPIAQSEPLSETGLAENFSRVSQVVFFEKLDEAQRRAAWAEIETLIVKITTAAPTWLANVEAELDWRRVQAVLVQGEAQRGTLLASLRLRGRLAEAPRALALARELEEGGRTAAARGLAETIVAEIPAFKPGRIFLEELLARAPAAISESAGVR